MELKTDDAGIPWTLLARQKEHFASYHSAKAEPRPSPIALSHTLTVFWSEQ